MDNETEHQPEQPREKSPARMALNRQQKSQHLQRLHSQIDKSRIRSKRKPSRFFVDNEYVHGGYLATFPDSCNSIFTAILVHCNTETQAAYPSIETIKDLSGCTNRNTLIKGIKLLEEYGIIRVIRSKEIFNMVNLYVFQSTRCWKPIPGWKEKMDKYNNKAQYQFTTHRSIKKPDYRSNRDDTLTNLRDNSPNTLTSIGDVLRKMQRLQEPDSVAIQEHSLHSVVGPEKIEPFPVNTGKIREPQPDTTGEIQAYRGNTSDTAIDENLAVLKREKTADEVEHPPFIKREKGTEDPFINGEKWTDEGTNNMGHDLNDQNIKSAYEH